MKATIRRSIILILVSLLISPKSFSALWDVVYKANKLPEKSGWLMDNGFNEEEGPGKGQKRQIVPDNLKGDVRNLRLRTNNKLLHIDDNKQGRRIMWFKTFKGEGNPTAGITVVARVKSVPTDKLHPLEGTQERNIGLSDGINPSDEVTFWPDRVQLGIGPPVGDEVKTHKLKGDIFHTYRVTLDDSGVRLYVDGLLALEMAGGVPADHWRAVHLHEIKDKPVGPAVTIGVAQAHDSVQDLYFDYVLVSFSGARPPGGDIPHGLIREYLAVDPSEKIATRWAKIKSSK